jgi:hypothetical protein
LADAQALQGHGSEAETRYEHCLMIFEKTRGANDPEVKRVIDRLGELYRGRLIRDIIGAGSRGESVKTP